MNESDELDEIMNQEMIKEEINQDSALKMDSNGGNMTTDLETNNERPSVLSTKKTQPGSAHIAAWMSAHVSVAGMSSIQSGGSPDAAAMTSPPSLMTTKAHPFRASSWVGPSSLEPSV